MPKKSNFLDYLEFEKRFSKHTINAYKSDLAQFESFLECDFDTELDSASHQQVRSWVVNLKESGNSHKTIHRKISSVKSYYKYHLRMGDLEKNPVSGIKLPKIEKRVPNFVKHSEMKSLKTELESNRSAFGELRDSLIILVLLSTGIRRSELIGLKDSCIDNGAIKVLGKRNKERIVPLPEKVSMEIVKYLNVKQQEFSGNSDYLFVTDKGQKLYEKFVYRIVNNYLALNTTLKTKSPHVLRHSYATELLNNGADLSAIKELLGHSSLAATQVYTHSSMEKIKEIYKSAHPRSIKK